MLTLIQQNVGRLEVKMPDAQSMELGQSLQNLSSYAHHLWHTHWDYVTRVARGGADWPMATIQVYGSVALDVWVPGSNIDMAILMVLQPSEDVRTAENM